MSNNKKHTFFHIHHKQGGHVQNIDLTEGAIVKKIIQFAIPLFLGQLLQQFYNMADAWVVGNFADNNNFAAVSSGGSLTFLIIGFFNGIAVGGGVIISEQLCRTSCSVWYPPCWPQWRDCFLYRRCLRG